MRFAYHRIDSPVGTILAVTDGAALHALDFHDYIARMRRLLHVHYGAVELEEEHDALGLRDRIARYFARDFRAFDGLPLLTNGTVFQRSVRGRGSASKARKSRAKGVARDAVAQTQRVVLFLELDGTVVDVQQAAPWRCSR